MLDTKLAPGENYPPRWHQEWRALLVIDGAMKVGIVEMTKNDVLLVEPNIEFGPFEPGPHGVHLLEVTRTAAAVPSVYRERYRNDPRYKATLARSRDIVFGLASGK